MPDVKDILNLMGTLHAADTALIEKAYNFAQKAHEGQKRFSGEPYFIHPFETGKELAKLGMGTKVVVAGLLHDTIEDANIAPETIEKEFGKEKRFLVEVVTKLGRFKYHGAERHRESLRKLLVATGKDVRVLIIKLMDRLHNMRTLKFVPAHKRERIALETLEIYASIAHRLGMGVVRRELEDLAFEYAYPEEYAATKKLLTEKTKETTERLEKMARALRRELAEQGIKNFQTDYRVKGLWSLRQKLKRKEGDISKIYDVSALRVVVPTVEECYKVLGMVHNIWQPLPNKIKDYIAFPKPNGYRSLHTTVFTGDGGIVEVQIRTPEMHLGAQFGIASHVMYKEKPGGGGGKQSSFDWIKSLLPRLGRAKAIGVEPTPTEKKETRAKRARYGVQTVPEWIDDLGDEADDPDFETALRSDIFSHRVFVFTPKGDVVDLPLNSSAIDFAYAIHSDIGDHVAGVKVNSKLVPLNTVLHNGDIVDIQTKKNAYPTKKWLDFAKTTLARRHIRNTLENGKKN